MDRRERREQLIAEDPVVGRQGAHDRRLHVEPAGQVAIAEALAADEHRPVAARLGDSRLVPVDGALVDDRAEPVRPDERVADDDRLGLLDELAHELVMDRPLDIDPRIGRALLPAEPEGASA